MRFLYYIYYMYLYTSPPIFKYRLEGDDKYKRVASKKGTTVTVRYPDSSLFLQVEYNLHG